MFLLAAGISVALSSCNVKYEVSEITQDTIMQLNIASEKKVYYVSLIRGKVVDKLLIRASGDLRDKTVEFPAGGICTIYPDSVVVKTANQHKLKIIFKK